MEKERCLSRIIRKFQVIQESLRMASIISFTFREAVVDVEYKGKGLSHKTSSFFSCCLFFYTPIIMTKDLIKRTGYLIPKGWKVMPLFRNIHHNPDFFPNPQDFDPSRFEVCETVDSQDKSR